MHALALGLAPSFRTGKHVVTVSSSSTRKFALQRAQISAAACGSTEVETCPAAEPTMAPDVTDVTRENFKQVNKRKETVCESVGGMIWPGHFGV